MLVQSEGFPCDLVALSTLQMGLGILFLWKSFSRGTTFSLSKLMQVDRRIAGLRRVRGWAGMIPYCFREAKLMQPRGDSNASVGSTRLPRLLIASTMNHN